MIAALAMAAMLGGGMIARSDVEDIRDREGWRDPEADRPLPAKPKRVPAIQPKPRETTQDTMTRQRRRAEERAAFKRLPAKS